MQLNNISSRLKQFCSGMFSIYTKKDEEFAYPYLNFHERSLFNQLPGFEKKHSVRVAKRMFKSARDYPQLDQRKLVRLGLLHDIGKIVEHNSIIGKSMMVIIRFFCPCVYNFLADRGKNIPFLRKFYVHKHHGAIGADLLEKIGESSEFLVAIRKHDPHFEPFGPEDPLELKILQEADTY